MIISGEDHTLGNTLRYILASSASTDFVGYSIPHPSEHVIHLRLQTTRGIKIQTAMIESCILLEDICDHIENTFDEAERRYTENQQQEKMDEQPTTTIEHQMEEID